MSESPVIRARWPALLRMLSGWLGGVLVFVAMLLGTVWALAHNEAATARALGWVPGLSVVGGRGALLGDFAADRLELALPRGGHLTVTEPAWRGLRLALDANAAWHLGVHAERVSARRVALTWVSGPPAPPTGPPASIASPVAVHVRELAVQEAVSNLWGEGRPFTSLEASVRVQALQSAADAAGLSVHEIVLRRLSWMGWSARGEARIGTGGRMPVRARVDLARAEGGGTWQLEGPLQDLQVRGDLAWKAERDRPPGLRVEARLQPFAAWPLPALQANARDLDLSTWWAGAPRTAWQGEVSVRPVGAAGLEADLSITNGEAGAWDVGRVPLQALRGRVSLPDARSSGRVASRLQAAQWTLTAQLPGLPGQAGTSGRLALTGGWSIGKPRSEDDADADATRTLGLALQGVHLRALDGRAPPLRLQGDIAMTPRLREQADPAVLSSWQAVWRARLTGEAQAPTGTRSRWPAQPVSLSLDAVASRSEVQVSRMQLVAPRGQEARLTDAVLRWSPDAAPAWSAKGALLISNFDPQLWLPWPARAQGANSVSGRGQFEVNAAGQGEADLSLQPSVLAGVPMGGGLRWQGGMPGRRASVSVQLDAGGNRVDLRGDWPVRPGQGSAAWWTADAPDQHWQAEVRAPGLASLQPMLPLLGLERLSGSAQGRTVWSGQWPRFTTEGDLNVTQLMWQTLASEKARAGASGQLASAQGRWQLDTRAPDAVLDGSVDVRGARAALGRVEQARVRLEGRGSSHTLVVDSDMVLARTAAGEAANREQVGRSTDLPLRLSLQAVGGVAGGGWQGRLDKLLWQGTRSGTQTVLEAQPMSLSVQPEPRGQRVRLGASRITVMGLTLDLQAFQALWGKGADGLLEADVRADVPGQNLAAWLQRWQPEGGWGGDLLVGGRIQLNHSVADPWAVDVTLARQAGDLTLSEPTIEGNSRQALGISEARVTLQARRGVWRLMEHFEGRLLGQLRGEQRVQVADPARPPAPADALSGQVDVQISSLRPWGGWVPAGWRLGGQLQGQATLAGTLGAPQYRGRLSGQRLALAQPLLGVQINEGELLLELEGDHARLTRLVARGPQGGLLSAEGDARFGEEVAATLRVQAERFALLQRVDRRLRVSGGLQATFGPKDIGVTGRVSVDEGLFDISRSDAPTIGDDVNVTRRPGQADEEAAPEAEASATPRKMQAAVDIDLGDALRLRGRGVDTLLTGRLRFHTPNNRPALTGTVRTASGTFAAYGQKLVIERGAITFTGPIENPRLDILAMRPQSASAGAIVSVVDVKVGVAITGTAQDPRVSLYSDPAMSETEKLSWLVLGRAPSGLGGADIGLLQTAAVALLSGEKSSPSDNLIGMLGLDQLSVRQSEGAVRNTIVSVGKQVSRYWYVGYERNLNATSGSWQLIYRLGQRMTLRFQAGEDNAVDLIRAWRWD